MDFQTIGFNATSMMHNDRWLSLEIARQNHLRYVELAAGKSSRAMLSSQPDSLEVQYVRNKLKEYGIGVHSIGAHRSLDRPQEADEFCIIMEKASELSCPVVTTAIPDGCDLMRYQEGLFTAAKRAVELGITICLENHGYEHGSGASLLQMTSAFGSEVGLCYDTGNVSYYTDQDIIEDFHLCKAKVRHIHLKDHVGGKGKWNFPALGRGTVPFSFLEELLQEKLSYSIEIEFTPQGAEYDEISRSVKESMHYLACL